MPKLISILTFYFLCFPDALCRSINIDFSHKFIIAFDDDYEEQESVDLRDMEIKMRNELENSVKQYQEQLKVVNFEIPANEAETDNYINDRKGSIPKMLGVAVPETTQNTNLLLNTPLPPSDARAHPRPKRSAENPGFETSPGQGTNASVEEMQKMLLKNILTYVGIGVAALFIVCMVCSCCSVIGPRTCCVAILTSPCCLIAFPCILSYIKEFLNPENVLRDNTYAYMPGIMVHENGKLQKYTPSPEEIEAVRDIIEIVNQMKY